MIVDVVDVVDGVLSTLLMLLLEGKEEGLVDVESVVKAIWREEWMDWSFSTDKLVVRMALFSLLSRIPSCLLVMTLSLLLLLLPSVMMVVVKEHSSEI